MPEPLNDVVRQRMKKQRRRDTSVEMAVRRELHSLGYRYRVDLRMEPTLRCRGDIVFTRQRLVVFIDGCFWHGCPVHSTKPKNNRQWWRDKLDANQERDQRNTQGLLEAGWTVLRFWEHEDPAAVVVAIRSTIKEA